MKKEIAKNYNKYDEIKNFKFNNKSIFDKYEDTNQKMNHESILGNTNNNNDSFGNLVPEGIFDNNNNINMELRIIN